MRLLATLIVVGCAALHAEESGDSSRHEAAPNHPLTSGPQAVLARDEELTLARRVVRPFVDRALATAEPGEQFWALVHWARLDPGDLLDRIGSGNIPNLTSDEHDRLRTFAAKTLLDSDRDEAAAVVETIENSSRRAEANVLLALTAPPSRQYTRELLEQAVLCARQEDVGGRAMWLACVADVLLDLDDIKRAHSLLDEAHALTGNLPLAGSAGGLRRWVAEMLARIDLPAALELIHDLAEDASRDDVHGRIAHRIAEQQPAEAERVLGLVTKDDARRRWAERVACRMAAAEPSRAERIAALITDTCHHALALGWMAGTRAATDKARARLWLDQAFSELRSVAAADDARPRGSRSAAITAALLVPVAEAIDPRLARSCFEEALSFRRARHDDNEQEVLTETATLALLLARYDRVTSRRLLEPIVELFERHGIGEGNECGGIAITAMLEVDPHWAAELVERLGSDVDRFGYWRDDSPWAVFAWTLGTPPEARMRIFFRDYLDGQYWLPGGPDNAFHARF